MECHPDQTAAATFCRVTDAHGTVINQGIFLPVDSGQAGECAGGYAQESAVGSGTVRRNAGAGNPRRTRAGSRSA